jgi:hypothetical protein
VDRQRAGSRVHLQANVKGKALVFARLAARVLNCGVADLQPKQANGASEMSKRNGNETVIVEVPGFIVGMNKANGRATIKRRDRAYGIALDGLDANDVFIVMDRFKQANARTLGAAVKALYVAKRRAFAEGKLGEIA